MSLCRKSAKAASTAKAEGGGFVSTTNNRTMIVKCKG
jgi:hypothetical protein